VLARVFLTVRFDALPVEVRTFVENLAKSASRAERLRGLAPVLSLVGTRGQEASWNARGDSRGHQGIPLISSSFVGAIPMISRLFRELGVPLHWIDSDDAQRIAAAVGRSAGLFFVPDAETAVDDHGRKIIAAQDFVATSGVKTVFGTGGAYAHGQILVTVLCRDRVPPATAEQFLRLADLFKGQTAAAIPWRFKPAATVCMGPPRLLLVWGGSRPERPTRTPPSGPPESAQGEISDLHADLIRREPKGCRQERVPAPFDRRAPGRALAPDEQVGDPVATPDVLLASQRL
jgi:hypothetical protein